jgi:hypothetical protein
MIANAQRALRVILPPWFQIETMAATFCSEMCRFTLLDSLHWK